MSEQKPDIIDKYFKEAEKCLSLNCAKVIFEPAQKREWFFEDNNWCYFEFLCEDNDYRLVSTKQKVFDESCTLRNMSYEIKMLLSFYRLRQVKTIEKNIFSSYVIRFEEEKELNPDLTPEEYNFALKLKEDEALKKSDRIATKILSGCLGLIIFTIILFGIFIVSMLFAPKAQAKSKYTQEFIQHFYLCNPYKESVFNTAYNSQSTYEIQGYTRDGSEKCIYVETNSWLRGSNVTTCQFDNKQLREYHTAMLNPDAKGSVLVKGMPVVGKNEEVVFLKFFNNPKVCNTVATPH